MLENIRGHSRGSIPPLRMPSLLPHDLCHEWNVSRRLPALFQWVNSSHEVAKVLDFQLQHQSFQTTPRTDLLQNGLVGSPCSPRDSQESSPTKASILWCSAFFMVQLSHPYMTTEETIALTRWAFVGNELGSPALQVDSLPAELWGNPNNDYRSFIFLVV